MTSSVPSESSCSPAPCRNVHLHEVRSKLLIGSIEFALGGQGRLEVYENPYAPFRKVISCRVMRVRIMAVISASLHVTVLKERTETLREPAGQDHVAALLGIGDSQSRSVYAPLFMCRNGHEASQVAE